MNFLTESKRNFELNWELKYKQINVRPRLISIGQKSKKNEMTQQILLLSKIEYDTLFFYSQKLNPN